MGWKISSRRKDARVFTGHSHGRKLNRRRPQRKPLFATIATQMTHYINLMQRLRSRCTHAHAANNIEIPVQKHIVKMTAWQSKHVAGADQPQYRHRLRTTVGLSRSSCSLICYPTQRDAKPQLHEGYMFRPVIRPSVERSLKHNTARSVSEWQLSVYLWTSEHVCCTADATDDALFDSRFRVTTHFYVCMSPTVTHHDLTSCCQNIKYYLQPTKSLAKEFFQDILLPTYSYVGRGSSVGIATRYGLDGPGIESWRRRDFPHPSRPALWPTQPHVQWVPGLSRG
jgi:hypothetical protein